jgi:hypothetical protein
MSMQHDQQLLHDGNSADAAQGDGNTSSNDICCSGAVLAGDSNSGAGDSSSSGSSSSSTASLPCMVDAKQLMQQLSDDVYALTVKTILRGARGVKLAHMLLGLVFTVIVQLGLLILLWYVVTHPTNSISKDTEKVWTQMGQLQGQLCWLQKALNKSGVNISEFAATEGDCAGAWPRSRGALASIYYVGCLGMQSSPLPTWKDVKPCLRHKVISQSDPSAQVETAPEGCEEVMQNVQPPLAAYGRGLLFPQTDLFQVRLNGTRCASKLEAQSEVNLPSEGTGSLISKRLSPLWPKKCLVDGGWVVQGNFCRSGWRDFGTQLKMSMPSYSECIVPLRNASVTKPDAPALVVNLIALLAIAVFVHDEVRRAVNLCHTAAAVAGILPSFYATSSTKNLNKAQVHSLLCIPVLCAPLFQLLIALLVLLSASMLFITQEMQASSIQVVLNSVALGFVLEIDNKVGHMIAAQQQLWSGGTVRISTFTLSNSPVSKLQSCMGHLYFACIGLFLTLEPVLLAPHAAVLVALGGLALSNSQYLESGAVTEQLIVSDTWSSYVFLKAFTGSGERATMPDWLVGIAVTSGYMLLVVALVLLLFYQPLPTAAARWPQTFLALQALTACGAAGAGMSYNEVGIFLATHFSTGCLVFITWVCMFMVWPTCHKEDPQHTAGPHCCCHGTCRNCCTICCTACCSSSHSTSDAQRCGSCCGTCCGNCCSAC